MSLYHIVKTVVYVKEITAETMNEAREISENNVDLTTEWSQIKREYFVEYAGEEE